MMQIIEQSKEEKMAMYMKLPKKKLAEMLINCNEVLDAKSAVVNCEKPTLPELKLTQSFPYLEFPEDNEIVFFQDHGLYKGVPDKVKFFIDSRSSRGVWLVADGYGVLKNNKFGLTGSYGNGKIAVDFKDLTPEIEAFCKKL